MNVCGEGVKKGRGAVLQGGRSECQLRDWRMSCQRAGRDMASIWNWGFAAMEASESSEADFDVTRFADLIETWSARRPSFLSQQYRRDYN